MPFHAPYHGWNVEPDDEPTEPDCPYCGDPMEPKRIGAPRLRRRAWVCPRDKGEVYADERGHLKRVAGSLHPGPVRVWRDEDLAALYYDPRDSGGSDSYDDLPF